MTEQLPVRKPAPRWTTPLRESEVFQPARIPADVEKMDRFWQINVDGMATVTHASKAQAEKLRDEAQQRGLGGSMQYVDLGQDVFRIHITMTWEGRA